jgi:hypothetical protein
MNRPGKTDRIPLCGLQWQMFEGQSTVHPSVVGKQLFPIVGLDSIATDHGEIVTECVVPHIGCRSLAPHQIPVLISYEFE